MFKMRRLSSGSLLVSPHWFVALNAASLLLAGENSFFNRHDSPSDLSLHLARDAFGHMVLSNQDKALGASICKQPLDEIAAWLPALVLHQGAGVEGKQRQSAVLPLINDRL